MATKERETREIKFSVKAVDDEQGIIEGYASVFGNVDWYSDVVDQGAFKRTLKNWSASGKPLPILWQHNPDWPIGKTIEAREDSRGLYVKGQIVLDSEKGREAYALLKAGAIDGLSIGYDTIEYTWNEEEKIRHLTEVRLWEWSPVTFPANEAATITSVKSQQPPEDAPMQTLDTKALAAAIGGCIDAAMASMKTALMDALAALDKTDKATDTDMQDAAKAASDSADAQTDPPDGTQPDASSTDTSGSDGNDDAKGIDIDSHSDDESVEAKRRKTITDLSMDDALALLNAATITEDDILPALSKSAREALKFSSRDIDGASDLTMEEAGALVDAMGLKGEDFISLCNTDAELLKKSMAELDLTLQHCDETLRISEALRLKL
jgi:HK97 family phage prohead protease